MFSLFRNPMILERTSQLIQLPVRYKRRGMSYRKRLGVFSYKIRPNQYYKNPHAISLHKKESYK